MSKFTWEVVEDPEPDPEVDRLLDMLVHYGRISDTYYAYIGGVK